MWREAAGGATTGDFYGTSYTLTSNIVGGNFYTFRLRAKNKWGWGDYSSTFNILAAMAPDRMARVITTINPSDGALKIQWTKPFENGSPVTAYQIELKDYNGVW